MNNLLILLLFFYGVTSNATSDWELVKDQSEIQVYSTQKPNHDLKHFKGQTLISAKIDTLLAALQDATACSEWIYNCISNQMVEMVDVRTRIYHTIIDAPLWFKDRDFYLQSQVAYNPTNKSLTIRLASKPDYAPINEKSRRLTDVKMVWTLERISEKVTAVIYQVYIDPKLPFKTINHAMIKKSVFKTLQGLKMLVKQPEYSETSYSESELEMLIENN